MGGLTLSSEEKGIVVFHLWKSLSYTKRILLSFCCIIGGLLIQIMTYGFFPGAILIFIGNLLLVVKGYDNRVSIKRYRPDAGWEKIERSQLDEMERLTQCIKKWDRSSLDITNGLGCFTFLLVCAAIFLIFINGLVKLNKPLLILSVDAVILFLPHWVTGVRKTLTRPNLLLKVKLIKKHIKEMQSDLEKHHIDYYILLMGKKERIPEDVKIRITIRDHHKDFLGLYGQIVLNMVSGTAHPYFYTVLVAKKGYGLKKAYENYNPPEKIIKEHKNEGDVEVFVIRQKTTRTSGYKTNNKAIRQIFAEGLRVAEKAAVK